jgi:hypothetical protein
VPGDERAEQDRGHPGLGDAVGDSQPRITECGPVDRPVAAERARGVQEQVGVEGDTAAGQPAGERGEDGGFPRAGSTGDNEQRPERGDVIGAAALGADGAPVPRLHGDWSVAGLAVVHPGVAMPA